MDARDQTAPQTDLQASNRPSVALALIMIGGLLIRLYGIAERGFWWDEIALWREALTLEFHTHAAVLPGLITSVFMRATNNYGSLVAHIPPVISGTLAIGAAYLLAKELFDTRTGLAAATLTAISPMTIYYSQEARPYGLLQLFATLLIYTFVRAMAGSSVRRWTWFTVVAVLCGHTHLLALQLLAGLTLAFVITLSIESFRQRRIAEPRRVLLFAASMLISFVLGYTWPYFRDHITRVFEGPSVLGPVSFVRSVAGALGAGLPIRLTIEGPLVWVSMPAVLLAIIGTWALAKKNLINAVSFVSCLVVSISILYFTLGPKAIWPWLRYLTHLWILVIVLIAAGWRHLPFRENRAVALLTFALLAGCYAPGLAWWAGQATELRGAEYRTRAAFVRDSEETLAGIIYPEQQTTWGVETLRNIDLYRLHREDSLPEYIVGEGIVEVTSVPSKIGGVPIPVRGKAVYRIPKGRYVIVARGGLGVVTLDRPYPIMLDELVDQGLVHF